MAKNLTPEQFEQACKNAIVAVEKNISKILINATNIASSTLQFRIFNRGQTTAGNTMRYRSAPYKKLRTDAGLQVNYKDLIFTGDLFYSMTILSTAENEVVYGFNNRETATIARYQEEAKQVGEPIFELSLKEEQKALRQVNRDLGKVFIGAIENFPNIPSASVLAEENQAVKKSVKRNKEKKKAVKQAKSKQSIEAQYTKRKATVEKTKQTIQKRQADIDKTRARLAKAKTPEAKQKIQDSLNKKKAKLQETKQRATKQVVARRKTRAKFKRITGK